MSESDHGFDLSPPSLPEEAGEKQGTGAYQKSYYLKNKKRLAARKKARYENETKLRERLKGKALDRYRELRKKELAKRQKNGWKPKKRGLNRPKTMQFEGRSVIVHSPRAFADLLGITVQSLTKWEEDGILPPPFHRDEKNHRWYPGDRMARIAAIVKDFKVQGGRRLADLKAQIAKGLAESGPK